MSLRDKLNADLKDAMKAGDKRKLGTIRLMNAAIKDKDIANRGEGKGPLASEDILVLLQKMVKQRRESIAMFEQGGRAEKAAEEAAEIAVIEEFLPEQMDEAATNAAIATIKTELGATSLKDMGRVIAALKTRHGSQLDMGRASALVKAALS